MTDWPRYHDRRALIDGFRDTLLDAASRRREREDLVDGDPYPEPGWVVYERGRMHGAVNIERAVRGLPPVPLEDVKAAERRATGHSDYVAMFAIGCADLVLAGDHKPSAKEEQ